MQIEFKLDPLFYGIWYHDLHDFSHEALEIHWENHGKAEGRMASFGAFANSLLWPFGDYNSSTLEKKLAQRGTKEELLKQFRTQLQLFLITADFSAKSLIQLDNDFDADFYRGWYGDLSGLNEDQLFAHWQKHGKKEGRQCNFRQLLSSQGLDADLLPNNFQAQGYAELNKTLLKSKEQSPFQLAVHYLSEGRIKGLSYYFDPYFYKAYYPDIQNVESETALLNHYQKFGLKEGRLPNLEALLNKNGQLGILARLRGINDLEWIKQHNPHLNTSDLSEFITQTVVRNPAQRNILFPALLDNANFYADIADWWAICEDLNKATKSHHTALSFYPILRSMEALSKLYAQLKQDNLAQAYRELALKNGSLKRDIATSYIDSKHQRVIFDDLYLVMQANPRMNLEKAIADRARSLWAQVNAKNKALASLQDRESIEMEIAAYANAVRSIFNAYYHRFAGEKRIEINTRSRKVLIIGDYHIPQCVRYRINQKVQHLREAGFEPETKKWNDEPKLLLKSLHTADIIIFYRCPAVPSMLKIVEKARALGKCCIYEIDDLIFTSSFPPSIENYAAQIDEDHYTELVRSAPLYAELAKACHFGIGSTDLISSKLEALVSYKQSFTYRNALDEFSPIRSQRSRTEKTFIDLFYGSATLAHNADFTGIVLPVILKLMRQYPSVRLIICGHLDLGQLVPNALKNRVKQIPFLSDVSAYMEVLATADINLAVLEVNEVTNSKSELKWIEAATFAIPSVVSNTSNYLDVIEDGITGLIASSQGDWQTHLERLIKDKKLREELGKNAQKEVERKYNSKVMSERIDQILMSCLAKFNSKYHA